MEKRVDGAEPKNFLWKRRLYLATGALCIFFSGVIYAWSILKVPFAEEFAWNASDLAVNFTFTFCFYCLGCIVAGIVLKRIGVRNTLFIAAAMVIAGFIAVSRMTGSSIAVLYISYGVMVGMGIGIAYIAIVSSVNVWFPDKPGFSSGILMMCFGISSLVMGNLMNVMFSIDGIGWRKAYLFLGIAICFVLVVGAFILRMPDAFVELPVKRKEAHRGEKFEACDFSTADMLRRKTFYLFFFYNVLTAAVGNTVFSFARDFALSVGATSALATFLVGIASVCNGCGRIVSGLMYDALGRRKTMLAVNALVILAAILMLTSALTASKLICIASLCCAGISYGCGSTISATFVGNFYGMKAYSMNLSIVTAALIPASMVATISSVMITASGSYVSTFIMLICCGVLAMVLNLNIRKP